MTWITSLVIVQSMHNFLHFDVLPFLSLCLPVICFATLKMGKQTLSVWVRGWSLRNHLLRNHSFSVCDESKQSGYSSYLYIWRQTRFHIITISFLLHTCVWYIVQRRSTALISTPVQQPTQNYAREVNEAFNQRAVVLIFNLDDVTFELKQSGPVRRGNVPQETVGNKRWNAFGLCQVTHRWDLSVALGPKTMPLIHHQTDKRGKWVAVIFPFGSF